MTPSRFIRNFILTAALLLGLTILTVVLFDPFYHYHAPLPGMKAVLTDKEYQCVGTLRNFEYDSLIVGSSVTENNDNRWFDELFGGRTIKAVRSYGGTADLCWLLDTAYEKHRLSHVFYNIDPAALSQPAQTTFEATGCPMYLYDRNPLNDYPYWLNSAVLFEKIPYMLVRSFSGYEEGRSYNWWEGKAFAADAALSHYERPEIQQTNRPAGTDAADAEGGSNDEDGTDAADETDTEGAANAQDAADAENSFDDLLQDNIALLTGEVTAHPETQFYFFFPPYSILWWDNMLRTGQYEDVVRAEAAVMKALLPYDNVRVYNFMAREDIITNLDNYMDTLHFRPEINRQMADWMAEGRYELHSEEEVDAMIRELRRCTEGAEALVTALTGEDAP